MKLASLTGLAVILAATLAAAQTKPNFSGSWMLDKEKSTMPQMGGGGGERGGGGGGGRGMGGGMAEAITIKQTDADITIESKMGERSSIVTYKTDGSEQTITMGRGEAKVKASWDGATLVTTRVQEMMGREGGAGMTVETKEVRSLDADGNLVVESMTKTPNGERTSKLVYKKS